MHKHKDFEFWSVNADGLTPKFDELKTRIAQHQPDAVAISETWLSPASITNFQIKGYTLFQRDRPASVKNGGNGGGVMLYRPGKIVTLQRHRQHCYPRYLFPSGLGNESFATVCKPHSFVHPLFVNSCVHLMFSVH